MSILATCSTPRDLVVIRGAGDIATGVAVRLYNSGFKVVMTESQLPTMIRCSVSFGQCIFTQTQQVESIQAVKATNIDEIKALLERGFIPVVIDEHLAITKQLQPTFLIDAILAKRNLNLKTAIAPITIALGPGFNAGFDCDAVIETNRGHHLGRVIYQGYTQENTGVPGNIAGETYRRVLRAPCAGQFSSTNKIGDLVQEGDIVAQIGTTPVYAPLSGMIRGLLNNDIQVGEGFKIGDIDPRGATADYTTVSDKARAIGGSVLEAMLHLQLKQLQSGVY